MINVSYGSLGYSGNPGVAYNCSLDVEHAAKSDVHKKYPEKLTFEWRLAHSLPYAIGGFMFFLGSFCYYPGGNMLVGGALFVVGATAFVFADTWEWWKNNRVGCFQYDEYRSAYESSIEHMGWDPEDTCMGKLRRAENGLNFGLSIIGSFLYFLGSLFFLPPYTYMVEGLWIFIAGSAVIMVAQSWKLYRQVNLLHVEGRTNEVDWQGVALDGSAWLGGFTYFFGSILFLPWIDTDDSGSILAANWFFFGGLCYVTSGILLLMRYFYYEPPLFPYYENDNEFIVGEDESERQATACYTEQAGEETIVYNPALMENDPCANISIIPDNHIVNTGDDEDDMSTLNAIAEPQ